MRVFQSKGSKEMKVIIFILSGLLVFFGSKFFPDFLTGIFFTVMLISGILMVADQVGGKKKWMKIMQ